MTSVFADTFYFLAVLNQRDPAHRRARSFAQSFRGLTVTTAWVLTELGDALCRSRERALFGEFLHGLHSDPRCRVIEPDAELFQLGVDLYVARSDQTWSLTDCISFVAMRREGLADALTGDRHFTQAGFNALLADSG